MKERQFKSWTTYNRMLILWHKWQKKKKEKEMNEGEKNY